MTEFTGDYEFPPQIPLDAMAQLDVDLSNIKELVEQLQAENERQQVKIVFLKAQLSKYLNEPDALTTSEAGPEGEQK